MRFVLFYHSLLSDWNHGNAHFLRGYARELLQRGHEVRVLEPRHGWSLGNLLADHGEDAITGFRQSYPGLESEFYDPLRPSVDAALDDADVVIVHEWSSPELVRAVGVHHRRHRGYRLLFHDTHHRMVTRPDEMGAYDLTHYDAVLAFGRVLRDLYLERDVCERAFTWHEAADIRQFFPREVEKEIELLWIGNWGDDERSRELREFLLDPVGTLHLETQVHGVRYPPEALAEVAAAGAHYAGFLPNYRAPERYARALMTVHVPRRPYTEALPGVPTIRVFEALACGVPLVSAPWSDCEGLFEKGDFLVARNGKEMRECLAELRHDADARARLAQRGMRTIAARHTCAHRVDELLTILAALQDRSVATRPNRGVPPCPPA